MVTRSVCAMPEGYATYHGVCHGGDSLVHTDHL